MRIVIDMQGAQTESRFRGIGRYTISLAQAIVRNRGCHEVILALSGLFPVTIEPIRAAFDGILPQENIRVWHAPGPVMEQHPENHTRRGVAELIREAFIASLHPDVIHISSIFEGYADDAVTSIGRFDHRTPVSVSLYDLIPLLNPEHYLRPNPSYEQYYLRKTDHLKRASMYLAISEFTRQEGLAHLDTSENTIINVSTAIEPHFRPLLTISEETVELLRQKFGLNRPFVLYTGGGDERKNLPRLIKAFATLPSPLRSSHQLLFAGKMSQGDLAHLQHIAQSSGLKPDELCFTGYVTDQELVHLYNLCELFVFPSWHEGFGLPALEAMACNAPVIGANTSSLPEVINFDAALFNPFDVSSIKMKMADVLKDEDFRTTLRKHGLQQAKRFSWDESGKRAIAGFKSSLKSAQQQQPTQEPYSRKPRLAFVSPLPPERTGIADYSADLLPALAMHYDIEVVVAQTCVEVPWVNLHGNVRDVEWFRAHADEIDRVLYQVGNSPFHQHMLPLLKEIPGTVVLHDFYMSGLMAWLELHAGADYAWTKSLYEAHGYGAVHARYLDSEKAKQQYPVNLHLLQHAQGVIVHSEYSRNLAQQWYGSDMADIFQIIPLLRSPVRGIDKSAARKQLGIDRDDFVVCSFGFLDPTKLNHRLLNCWLSSSLANNSRCRLFFVGENHGGDYGASLLQTIRSSSHGSRICITGYASSEIFRQYLMAADVTVQLRTQSRGETSAAVFDCMNHAQPLIVNANGSMAELDPDALWMLPDEFNDFELVEALETLHHDPERRRSLGDRGRQIIDDRHTPDKCAERYAEAIEHFHNCSKTTTSALIHAIAQHQYFSSNDPELLSIAKSISDTFPMQPQMKRLFLDISATCRTDLKTGIERVARALLIALLTSTPIGYRIEPVYLSKAGGAWHYRYARRYTLDLLNCPSDVLDDEVVDPECGDWLLGLDLFGDNLGQAAHDGFYAAYRNKGVKVTFIVFDLLPVQMPLQFPPGANKIHAQWLHTISKFDGAICISKAVADDLAAWQTESGLNHENRRAFQIDWFHLGADMENSAPTYGFPKNANSTLYQISTRPSFLMVGTIEPRKGYLQSIEAFSKLWNKGIDVNLVVVGKEGWKDLPSDMRRDIPETIKRLQNHPELNKHLFWLEGISDEYLEKVYTTATCLVAASEGEGFGLPLIEAAQHKLPIIARDIPVFREVAGEYAYYFPDSKEPTIIYEAILDWLELNRKSNHPLSVAMPWQTWKESSQQLIGKFLK